MKPLHVCITGAAGQIGQIVAFKVANGEIFGKSQLINLALLDIEPAFPLLEALQMELEECLFSSLKSITITTDLKVAFEKCQYAILIGAKPRGKNMQRKDLIEANSKIFEEQGRAINEYADRRIKVLVVGNPANTNCLICLKNAPRIRNSNFCAMTRLDLNRAKYQIALKANRNVSTLRNVIIWGNHSSTQFPDVSQAYFINEDDEIDNENDEEIRVEEVIKDKTWIQKDFIELIQQRGTTVINARGLSSAASAAQAICDHMRDWIQGTPSNSITSFGVISDGSYGIPRDIVYSFPVVCFNSEWQIIKNLKIEEFTKKKMEESAKELIEEKETAFRFLNY
ncbi:malate dehydrogenase [Anaeramoeba ignava]|uniref:Malate dehydrogenase n=1 Tax=Anaeramoeba ignava TaxID=1746090 RepID=A0A9Q0LTA7_ANAIG|nr:malate dehydrogenase [Anaeramoeba ignava]